MNESEVNQLVSWNSRNRNYKLMTYEDLLVNFDNRIEEITNL